MALSDQLTMLAARAKEAEDRATAARGQAGLLGDAPETGETYVMRCMPSAIERTGVSGEDLGGARRCSERHDGASGPSQPSHRTSACRGLACRLSPAGTRLGRSRGGHVGGERLPRLEQDQTGPEQRREHDQEGDLKPGGGIR
jgi:hypothetical protein